MEKRAIDDLARSGIAPEQAEGAGIFDVPDASCVYPDFKPLPALIIPYFAADGAPVTFEREGETHHFCRVRYTEAPAETHGFMRKKPLRYSQPAHSGVFAYFPQVEGVNWAEIAADPTVPLVITEGEKKALAATIALAPTIALGGVFNFLRDGALLPELEAFQWRARDVWVAFDSDAAMNPNIQYAEARLVEELLRKRGANVYLVRIPPEGDDKVGLDDYLVKHGAAKLQGVFEATPPLGTVDAAVVEMNRYVAWIEHDGAIYDLQTRKFVQKSNFLQGSVYSSSKVLIPVVTGRKPGVKELQVSRVWLNHPHAQRYADLLFRPGEPETLPAEGGGVALNVWHGWGEIGDGDVAPWLELSAHLFSRLKPDLRNLPIRLMAYKVQNPAEKVPLALVLLGEQGCGKSLWAECLREAMAPYGVELGSKDLDSPFQGWLERSLLAVINEAEGDDLFNARHRMKALISDVVRPMNEKYRVARNVRTYTQYILTANERRVGAYSNDDRRMVVVACPKKREPAFYDRISVWKRAGGPKHLLGYLLRYDLNDWRPPATAPMTPEKHMAYMESLTPAQRLAEDMRTASEHALVMWLDAAVLWAQSAAAGNNYGMARQAQEILDSVGAYQIRPWYTPEEIAMMFPAIVATLHGNRKMRATVAGEISRELREAGIPYLECADDPRGFRWRGRMQQFLVVMNQDDWINPLSQSEFERLMGQWPRYADVRAQAAGNRGLKR